MAMKRNGRLLWNAERVAAKLLSGPVETRQELLHTLAIEEFAHRAQDVVDPNGYGRSARVAVPP